MFTVAAATDNHNIFYICELARTKAIFDRADRTQKKVSGVPLWVSIPIYLNYGLVLSPFPGRETLTEKHAPRLDE